VSLSSEDMRKWRGELDREEKGEERTSGVVQNLREELAQPESKEFIQVFTGGWLCASGEKKKKKRSRG